MVVLRGEATPKELAAHCADRLAAFKRAGPGDDPARDPQGTNGQDPAPHPRRPSGSGGGEVKVAVVGAGAIGAYVGAALHRGGADVHLIARGEHLAAMRQNGITVLSPRGDFHAQSPFDGRSRGDRPGRHRVPRTEGVQLRRCRAPHPTAAATRHRGRRRAERHPLVVLPRAPRPLRRPPRRGGRSRRCRLRRDRARAGHRLRRVLLDRDRIAWGDPPHRGHPVFDRGARRHDLAALHGVQRGDGRGRPEVPGRGRPAIRHLAEADGQHRLQPDQRAHRRDDGTDRRAPGHARAGPRP